MTQPLLNRQQCQQSMAITLQEDLWSIQRETGNLEMSEQDYKEVRVNLIKSISILSKYTKVY
jgi:hypothetical protein